MNNKQEQEFHEPFQLATHTNDTTKSISCIFNSI